MLHIIFFMLSKRNPTSKTLALTVLFFLGSSFGINVDSLFLSSVMKSDTNEMDKYLGLGANIELKASLNSTPLNIASYRSDFTVAKYLVNHGANVNVKNQFGKAPLDNVCVTRNNTEFAKLLLDHGAKIDSSHFINSMIFGNTETIRMLLERGANPNVSIMNKSESALQYSRRKHATKIESILLSFGAQ